MSQNIKSYNNLSWFKTENKINQVKNYIQNNEVPGHLNATQRNIFLYQFNNNHWIVENNHIYYRPSDRVNLRVVEPDDDKDDLLNEIYNDDTLGLSLGLNKFYDQVQQHYLGIKKLIVKHG